MTQKMDGQKTPVLLDQLMVQSFEQHLGSDSQRTRSLDPWLSKFHIRMAALAGRHTSAVCAATHVRYTTVSGFVRGFDSMSTCLH